MAIRKGGKKLCYVASAQGNVNLLIGKVCTAFLEPKPGDKFEIKLDRKQVRLVPTGSNDNDD